MNVVGETLSSTNNAIYSINNDFMNYVLGGSLIVIAASVCIGVATKELVFQFTDDILGPIASSMKKINIIYMIYEGIRTTFKPNKSALFALEMLFKTVVIFLKWSLVLFLTYLLFVKVIKMNYITTELTVISKLGKVIQEQIN
jgi:large-conductance mechanosensitive channel